MDGVKQTFRLPDAKSDSKQRISVLVCSPRMEEKQMIPAVSELDLAFALLADFT